MLFYFLFLFFVLLVIALVKKSSIDGLFKYKSKLLFILETVIILVFVFRYDVGWDYVNYYDWVRDEISNPRLEPLSALFLLIAQYFKSPQLLFVLYGTLTYLCVFKAVRKYSCNIEFSLLIYFCLFLFDSFGLIRQSLAVAIIILGYKYIYDRKILKYTLIVILAIGFHYSAIIALVFPFVYRMKFSFFALSLIAFYLLKEIFFYIIINEGNFAVYLLVEDMMTGGGKILIFYIVLFFGLFYFVIRSKDKQVKGLYKIFSLTFYFWLLLGAGIAVRLSSFCTIFLLLLLPAVLNKYAKLRLFTGVICVIYFIIMLVVSSKNEIKSPYLPYKNYFLNKGDPFK